MRISDNFELFYIIIIVYSYLKTMLLSQGYIASNDRMIDKIINY
jgi:hypothetical protein